MFSKICSYTLLISCLIAFSSAHTQAQSKKTPTKPAPSKTVKPVVKPGPVRICIYTDSGSMIIKLSDSTPLHRDNFVKLVKEGFYDSLLFHRVIPQFMMQGGDPTSKYAAPGARLGNGGDQMVRIPAEFNPTLFHKRGALAAARDGNPEKASSACQYYIVDGKTFTDEQLTMLERQNGVKYTEEQRTIYKTIGGTAQLDQKYTVFGEVEAGLEVISKITGVAKDGNNRPYGNVRMRMEIME